MNQTTAVPVMRLALGYYKKEYSTMTKNKWKTWVTIQKPSFPLSEKGALINPL